MKVMRGKIHIYKRMATFAVITLALLVFIGRHIAADSTSVNTISPLDMSVNDRIWNQMESFTSDKASVKRTKIAEDRDAKQWLARLAEDKANARKEAMTSRSARRAKIAVRPSPDFNGDSTVDVADFLEFVAVNGSSHSDADYDAKYDLDSNNEIGFSDFLAFVNSYGNTLIGSEAVTIADANLRAVIADSLGKAIGVPITRAEMATLTVIEAGNKGIHNLIGLEHATSLQRLSLGRVRVSDELVNNNDISDLSPLSRLTNLEYLSLTSNNISDLSPLSRLTNLTGLHLGGNNSISDISSLSGLTNLISLNLWDNSISNISALSRLTNLTLLGLSNNSISDLSPLSRLTNLEYLSLTSNNISDLSPLSRLTNLTGLHLGGNNSISDISSLSGLTNLISLNLWDNSISNISTLSRLTNLTRLGLSNNSISNISALSNLTNLESLNLWDNSISGLSPLSRLTNLTLLALGNNSISDISALSNLTNLITLYLNGNSISGLSPLSRLTNLESLNLWDNSISDISALSNLTNLESLNLWDNSISDISALSNLTNLESLNLWDNSISGLSPLSRLTNLEYLDLDVNSISDISPLVINTGLGSGDRVYLQSNPLSRTSINLHIPALQRRGVTVVFDSSSGSEAVTIADANLRAVIADSLGKAIGVPITRAEMATLTVIEAGNKGIHNLIGLEHATSLQRLSLGRVRVNGEWVNNNDISDLSPLSRLTNLEYLDLTSNSISGLSPLSRLTNLTGLHLGGNNSISDISSLSGLTNLISLNLWDNSISNISALSRLTNLTLLGLSNNSISNISALSNLTNLESLYLWDNSISDISTLSRLTNLTLLTIGNNSISGLSPLSRLTNLESLYLWDNSISDISALSNLTNLEYLDLDDNSISDIFPLVTNTGLGSGDRVYLQSNPLSRTSINLHIPALQRRGVTVVFDSSGGESPDLIVESPSVSDNTLTTGQSFTLSARVRNQGTGQSASTTLRYYRSSNSTISASDAEVGTDTVNGLSASGTSVDSISLNAPSSAGTYYYGACIESVRGESNTNNNCSTGVRVSVNSSPPPPPSAPTDVTYQWISSSNEHRISWNPSPGATYYEVYYHGLSVGGSGTLSFEKSILIGERITDTTYGYNKGRAGTIGYWVKACNDADRCSVPVQAAEVTVSSSSGSGNTYGVGELLPNFPSGVFFPKQLSSGVNISTNSGRVVFSFNTGDFLVLLDDTTYTCIAREGCGVEAGRVTSGTISVTVPSSGSPDLIVESPSVSDNTLTTGQSFTLSARVRNQGNAQSVATTLRYYRSTDATISTGDTQVGTDPVSVLSASGTSPESISLTAPSSAGTYYYGACVESVRGESNTNNNCSTSVRVSVNSSGSPDLIVESPSVSDNTLTTGQSFTLSARVRNQGNAQSVVTTLRYYRSSDSSISTSDTQVGTDSVGGLSASGTSVASISLNAPSSAGTYYYGACIESVRGESNTNNNCSTSVRVSVNSSPPPPPPPPPPPSAPPPAPAKVWYQRVTLDKQRISWTPSLGATYYKVYYSVAAFGAPNFDEDGLIADRVTNTTYEYDGGRLPGIGYWVKACNDVGCSDEVQAEK